MKNIIRYIACGLSAFLMTACGDMYEIHEKYLILTIQADQLP